MDGSVWQYGGGTNDLEIAIQEIHRYNHFTPFEQGMGDSDSCCTAWLVVVFVDVGKPSSSLKLPKIPSSSSYWVVQCVNNRKLTQGSVPAQGS
jgi:hypothetical protein